MYSALRRILFALEAERAHDVGVGALAAASRSKTLCALLARLHRERIADLPVEVMGMRFPHPVGLAAGLDKHARAGNALHALGFGFIELGTVTPLPQPGNSRPRLFRIENHNALINRMGFNSVGLAAFCRNLAGAGNDARIITGVNIGKNAATAFDKSADDYIACLDATHEFADYVALNISSPNTPNLRDLQHVDALDPLLSALDRRRMQLADAHGRRVPLALKISPDLDAAALDTVANLARKHRIDAVAATNTTSSRAGIERHALANESGGLSGAPLADVATATVARLFRNLQGEIPIIGVGGVDSAARALEKFQAGADLVQIYTGFIYRGPGLIRDIVDALRAQAGDQTLREFLADLRAPHEHAPAHNA
ncbi:MAG: quinone-dependent dihydroorotate dehydrogenase [Gammaproteobacteria bacterium]|nr:quinone-dependent dihydroorotate dehydrogenase [Gammaproteobacteria bacterium]